MRMCCCNCSVLGRFLGQLVHISLRHLANSGGLLPEKVQGAVIGRVGTIPEQLIIVGNPARTSSNGAMPKLSDLDG